MNFIQLRGISEEDFILAISDIKSIIKDKNGNSEIETFDGDYRYHSIEDINSIYEKLEEISKRNE